MWPFKDQITPEQIEDMVTNRIEEIVGNDDVKTNATEGWRERFANTVSGGNDVGDSLHTVAQDYGWPDQITFHMFWNMYRRFGIAKNLVELPVDTTWMTPPEIESKDTAFEKELDKIITDLKLWQRLKGLDTRQRVGRYAGLFMRVRDGKQPDQPIAGKLSGVNSLVQIIPLYEGQLKVSTIENDPAKENYGLPTMYQFSTGTAGNRDENQSASFSIHPSRIVIAAEGADNGDIYGIPALEAAYNSLMDLRKIVGAGGEGFYKNAAQSIILELQDGASAKDNATLLNKMADSVNDFIRNRFRRIMWVPGAKANVLQSALQPPKEFFMNALNDVAAAAKIPATILIGQQTGRLASSEDGRSFLTGVKSRRENFTTEMITNVIDWCMEWGILTTAKYEVKWDDLLALSDTEKLENSDKMADINVKQFQSGGDVPFSGDEVREAGGFEVEKDDLPPENEDIDDLDPDDKGEPVG